MQYCCGAYENYWQIIFQLFPLGNRRNKDNQAISILRGASNQLIGDENIELPLVSFKDIVTATNDFSNENMLGQGGFGKVYKVTK